MTIEVFKRHEISHEKRLQVIFYTIMAKAIVKLRRLSCSRCAAFAVCKQLFESRTVENLLSVGRQDKFTKIADGHVTLPVLEPLMQVHNFSFISS